MFESFEEYYTEYKYYVYAAVVVIIIGALWWIVTSRSEQLSLKYDDIIDDLIKKINKKQKDFYP